MVDKKTLLKFQCILASFMSFVHNCPVGSEYSHDHVRAMAVLAAITHNDVLRYMNLKMFGTTEPAGDVTQLWHCKHVGDGQKGISYFMRNCNIWDMTRAEGNPTCSALVNTLIKGVKKREARKQGVDSQTKCPILGQECVLMHDLLNRNVLSAGRRSDNAHDIFWKRYGILAMMNFELYLITSVDYSTQLVLEHI